jgi:mRNA interferase RelE/StbE
MYDLRIRRRAIKDIANLPKDYTRLVSERIETLTENPRPIGAKRLRGRTDYSLRVGTYRILYEIYDEERIVIIYRVKHRREAYR